MGSTYHQMNYHLVFSTKGRIRIIGAEWREQLHAYLGGTIRGLDGIARAVGGVSEHVHLLVGLTPSHRVADFMRELKKATSIWASGFDRRFSWQEGYSVFAIGMDGVDRVRTYIEHQETHHHAVSYLEELTRLFEENKIPYDPRFF
ncbi:MAG: IS200/IS605 family transposase [Ignavibacteria bacterium]|nr:IS200/IS605 family transposase [Ignavibacteria bacterium]